MAECKCGHSKHSTVTFDSVVDGKHTSHTLLPIGSPRELETTLHGLRLNKAVKNLAVDGERA